MRIFLVVPFVFLTALPTHAQELVFSMRATDDCIGDVRPGAEAACVGRSAEQCMIDSEGGGSNLGASACYGKELEAWDARLNDWYAEALREAREADADMEGMSFTPPSQEEALRQMQRAWITFRDAKCEHVASLYQGGTGAGPASAECQMYETGAQAIYLRRLLNEEY